MIFPDRLVPAHIFDLRPYEPGLSPDQIKERFGLTRVIKLASNENPLGASPKALECARRALSGMYLYPDGGLALRHRLADYFSLRVENVIAGSGSEGIMANVVRTFLCDEDEVLTTESAFGGFQVLARSRGVPYRTVAYRDWHYDLPALANAVTPRTKLVYLANPNNPTGTFFTRSEFEEFHRRVPERVLIILDEAYFEFAANHTAYPDSLLYRFDNVITLRTFSKAYGLAGARIGYGFAHQDLVAMLLKIKLPFEPSGIASAAALGALDDREFLDASVANNAAGLRFLTTSLREIGIEVVPSAGNFLMILFSGGDEAQQVFQALLERGIIVRPLVAMGVSNGLRVSIGTPNENETFIQALQGVISELETDKYATTC